jgi:hypothetical protein
MLSWRKRDVKDKGDPQKHQSDGKQGIQSYSAPIAGFKMNDLSL